jgi:DNA-binding transcriptional LysR family regulator
MSHFDHFDLDGHLLELLVAVHEERSVTGAALRLGVTQSAVSHLLDKLRAIVGDPLFVRAGRGIVATERADELVRHARRLLDGMRSFVTAGGFDPARLDTTVTIAANDLQRDLLLPLLLRQVRQRAPGLRLRVIASGVPRAEMLRDGGCQLVITPRPPDAPDLLHKRLFEDRYAVFYDAAQRKAPRSAADFLAADHVTVVYEPHRAVDLDLVLAERGVLRRFVATVPNSAGVAALLKGSDMLATLPSLLRVHLLRDLALADVPVPCPPMPMYLVWHLRHQADPLQAWLRQQIGALVPAALAEPDLAAWPPVTCGGVRLLPESAIAAEH